MNGSNIISETFFRIFNDFIFSITNGHITDILINFVFFLALILWVYVGLRVYVDAKNRFVLSSSAKALFVVFGVLTGPFGYFLYSVSRPKFTPAELEFIDIEHKFYFHQASKIRDCVHCKSYVLEGHTFCSNCGTQNRFRCESCNALTDHDDKYCFTCGGGLHNHIFSEVDHATETLENQTDKKVTKPVYATFMSAIKSFILGTKNGIVKVLDFGSNLKQSLKPQKEVKEVVLEVAETNEQQEQEERKLVEEAVMRMEAQEEAGKKHIANKRKNRNKKRKNKQKHSKLQSASI